MQEDTNLKSRRWRVTYTKHLKQKRKVYHDGLLHLSASPHKVKVLLYDESGNLIDSKYLGQADSDSVHCGASFTMDAHLVDILASHPVPTTPLPQSNASTSNSFNNKTLHSVSNSMQNNTKAPKKAQPCTTALPSSNSTLPHSLLQEWSVLYTTQLTQKAKKYHDGILRLSQLGSHAKQVRLYDENERLLESKVLAKEDILQPGQTLIMQAHLVDIGLSTIQVGKENSSVTSLIKPFQKPSSTTHRFFGTRKDAATVDPSAPERNSILKEWNVLYTTQLNKKAKTYHDGILRLALASGSHTKQITLAGEDGQILCSRYLKSFERIETGNECELTGYLVQVDDLRACQEDNNQRTLLKQFVKSKTLMKSIPTTKNGTDDETKMEQMESINSKSASSLEMEKSTKMCGSDGRKNGGVDDETKKKQVKSVNSEAGNSSEMEKPTSNEKFVSVARRDAFQIMSVLKKPSAVLETEAAQVVKNAQSSSHFIKIDNKKNSEEQLPSAQGKHASYENACHSSSTSPFYIGFDIQASEGQMVKENLSSSSVHNRTSVLAGTIISTSYESRCKDLIALGKVIEREGCVEDSFASNDEFDFPSFDLGF